MTRRALLFFLFASSLTASSDESRKIVIPDLSALGASVPGSAVSTFSGSRGKDGRIRIRGFESGGACAGTLRQVQALIDWKKKRDGVSPLVKDEGNCTYDVTDLLPGYLRQTLWLRNNTAGPNCWNTALTSAGLTPYLRYATPEEFRFWLESPLCRLLAANEAPEPGDIGAVVERNPGGKWEELHGFVHLTPELSVTKQFGNGYHHQIISREKMLGMYMDGKKETGPLSVVDRQGREIRVDHYRCESFAEFEKREGSRPPPRLARINACVGHLDSRISGAALFDRSPVDLRVLTDSLNALEAEARAFEDDGNGFDYRGAILHRIRALRFQVRFIDESEAYRPDFHEKVRR